MTSVKITFPDGKELEINPDADSFRIGFNDSADAVDAAPFSALAKAFITLVRQYAVLTPGSSKELAYAEMFVRTACMWAVMGITKE
jgi:hypothetical protein